MFVSEIITEQEFTFQRDVKSGTYTILNPQGQPVGSERTPGAARAQVKKLTKNLKTKSAGPSPADKLKSKASSTVDRTKGVDAANKYLDKKGVTDKETIKTKPTRKGVLKTLRKVVGKAGIAGIVFQVYIGYDKAMQQIEIYLKEYEAAGYDVTNPRVIKAQKNLHDNISQTFIAAMTAGAVTATAMKVLKGAKGVKNFVNALRGVGMLHPVGWILNILSFIGVEAAIYAISKVLSSSETVQKYLSDMVIARIFSHNQLIGGTPQGTKKYPKGSPGAMSTTDKVYKKWNESLMLEKASSQQITKDAIKAFKDDDKLMAMYVKAKKLKAKAKAKAS